MANIVVPNAKTNKASYDAFLNEVVPIYFGAVTEIRNGKS